MVPGFLRGRCVRIDGMDIMTEYTLARIQQTYPDRERLQAYIRKDKAADCLHLFIDPEYGVCDRCGMLAENIVTRRGFL